MKTFYDELTSENFYEEKVASEDNSDTRDMLDTFSADELEVIASELGILYEKEAAEESIEQKIDAEEKKEEVPVKEEKEVPKEEKKEEVPEKDEKEAEEETAEVEKEAEETPAEETEEVEKEAEETPAEETEEVEKEAEEDESEIIKIAYDIALEKLASSGKTLEDYVFSKVANEELASFIADKAEKLAYVAEKNALQVADDILVTLEGMITTEAE